MNRNPVVARPPILTTPVGAAMQHARDIWGWSVIPVDPRQKRPLVAWHPFQQRFATDAELARWATAPGFAVVTGRLSGVLVVDLDPGASDTLHPPTAAPTVCSRTPRGGWHLFYRCPDGAPIRTRAHMLPAVDLRAEGGIAVLPVPGQPDRQWLRSPDDGALAPVPLWVAQWAPSPTTTCGVDRTSAPAGKRVPPIFRTRSPAWHFDPQFDALETWTADAALLSRALAVIGIPTTAADGVSFRCVLPGHTDRHASASLYRTADGVLLYRDWHRPAGGPEWLPLATVRAAQAYGRLPALRAPELAVWTLRLVVEAGRPPAPVPGPLYPSDASPAVRRVGEAIHLLFGCRWLRTPGDPAPLTWRFLSAWAGVSERHAGAALGTLLRAGIVEPAGKHGRLALFLPGQGSPPTERGSLS